MSDKVSCMINTDCKIVGMFLKGIEEIFLNNKIIVFRLSLCTVIPAPSSTAYEPCSNDIEGLLDIF
jgi:hypothetical protein